MTKLRGIAAAVTALMASGAFAANTTKSAPVANPLTLSSSATAPTTIKKTKAGALKNRKSKATVNAAMLAKTESSARADSIGATSSSRESSARADSIGTSVVEGPSQLKKPSALDNIKFGLVFEFYGPSVVDPFSGYQPALSPSEGDNYAHSQGDSAQDLRTNIVVGYRINKNMTFVLNPVFQTVGDSASGEDKGSMFRFKEADSYAKLGFGKFLKAGKFTWNGDFRVYPGGLGDATAGRPFYLRNGQNFMYSVAPKWTLAAYNTIRYYQRSEKYYFDHPTAYNWRATFGPAIEYQLTDKAGLALSYNTEVRTTRNTGALVEAPVDASFFEAGAIIDLSKLVNLNPYIDVYPNTPNIEAWQFGATVAFNIL